MKRLILSLLFSCLSVVSASERPSLSFTGEVYGQGSIKDAFQMDAQNFVAQLAQAGVPVNFNTTASPGVGGEAALLFPRPNDFELGLAFSYIKGPDITQQFNGGLNGSGELKADIHYLRYLVEGAKRFPITDAATFRIGAGVGFASAHISQSLKLSGPVSSYSSFFSDKSTSESWSGVTGEIGPSLLFDMGNGFNLEFGARVTFLPNKSQSDNISRVKWSPLSVFAGLRFPL